MPLKKRKRKKQYSTIYIARKTVTVEKLKTITIVKRPNVANKLQIEIQLTISF